MTSVTKDYKKIENLVNRGLALILYLEKIIEANIDWLKSRSSFQLRDCTYLYTSLYDEYSTLKGILAILKDDIKVHDSLKSELSGFIQRCEDVFKKEGLNRAPNDKSYAKVSYVLNKCTSDLNSDEEKIQRLANLLYDFFVKKEGGRPRGILSHTNYDTYFIDIPESQKLKNEWIKYRKKFAEVITEMIRLLNTDESIEQSIEEEFKEILKRISEGGTQTPYPPHSVSDTYVDLIGELEEAYKEL